jgi:hypothetical protein
MTKRKSTTIHFTIYKSMFFGAKYSINKKTAGGRRR